jgi:hypothetical protein
MNILPFPELKEIQVELDKSTIEKLHKLAEREGTTVELFLDEALDVYLAEFRIGEQLLEHLKTLRETAGKPTRRAIEHWQDRIQTKLDQVEEGGPYD